MATNARAFCNMDGHPEVRSSLIRKKVCTMHRLIFRGMYFCARGEICRLASVSCCVHCFRDYQILGRNTSFLSPHMPSVPRPVGGVERLRFGRPPMPHTAGGRVLDRPFWCPELWTSSSASRKEGARRWPQPGAPSPTVRFGAPGCGRRRAPPRTKTLDAAHSPGHLSRPSVLVPRAVGDVERLPERRRSTPPAARGTFPDRPFWCPGLWATSSASQVEDARRRPQPGDRSRPVGFGAPGCGRRRVPPRTKALDAAHSPGHLSRPSLLVPRAVGDVQRLPERSRSTPPTARGPFSTVGFGARTKALDAAHSPGHLLRPSVLVPRAVGEVKRLPE